jgi:selenide,water dikinase
MSEKRFVDYARHGGCSMKLAPGRLKALLGSLDGFSNGRRGWPDADISKVGAQRVASSVDVVLPMIDDPAQFGRIVVNHVLSDLYAVGAEPIFALSILGIPKSPDDEADEDAFNRAIDAEVELMLLAADEELRAAGATSAGGHTLMDHALFFGMAATGGFPDGEPISNRTAEDGDVLVLTKPIGTSVATKLWKTKEESKDDFGDIVDALLRSNRQASLAMRELSHCACTDVTGFGLCGHLHNMLRASEVSGVLRTDDVPVFASVVGHPYSDTDTSTRLLTSNREFLRSHLPGLNDDDPRHLLLLDAQVSGGLLIAMPPGDVDLFQARMREHDEETWIVGEVTTGKPGEIALV